MARGAPWEPEEDRIIRRLNADNVSARDISAALGRLGYDRTRGAVIGRLNRIGLSVEKKRKGPDQTRGIPAIGGNVRLCQWPTGHPRDADFKFCGAKVVPGRPYCAGHCERAYQRAA